MNFIIYDIEATCWEQKSSLFTQEIIEIGAVKVNAYGEALDVFCRFIRPVLHPSLSFFCQNLTGISQIDVNRAKKFPDVIDDFIDWIDIWDEDYLLCSWGSFDKKMLIQDCELHRMESDWAEEHINIKRQYHDMKRLHRPRGLKRSVEKEGFEFTGDHHRGIDDAKNLAKLFCKYLDEWQY